MKARSFAAQHVQLPVWRTGRAPVTLGGGGWGGGKGEGENEGKRVKAGIGRALRCRAGAWLPVGAGNSRGAKGLGLNFIKVLKNLVLTGQDAWLAGGHWGVRQGQKGVNCMGTSAPTFIMPTSLVPSFSRSHLLPFLPSHLRFHFTFCAKS